MKIYVVVYDSYDGECSFDIMIKAFTEESDAQKFADLCTDECKRIRIEVDKYYLKHKEEMHSLSKKIRDLVLTKGKWLGPNKHPESIRRLELLNQSDKIIKSHKYHPDFSVLLEEYQYTIQELELD